MRYLVIRLTIALTPDSIRPDDNRAGCAPEPMTVAEPGAAEAFAFDSIRFMAKVLGADHAPKILGMVTVLPPANEKGPRVARVRSHRVGVQFGQLFIQR